MNEAWHVGARFAESKPVGYRFALPVSDRTTARGWVCFLSIQPDLQELGR